jgi:acyl carrier protein
VTREEILAELTRTLVDAFDLDPAAVTPEARLVDDLDLDSIDAIDLSVKAQPLAGRKMTDEEVRALRTVGDVVALIERMKREG